MEQRQNRLITGFVLLSLLLHLLLLLVPKDRLFPAPPPKAPVYVEMRPTQDIRDRELDIPIRKELEKPREKPAKRLAEKDQVVEQETAPEGKDTEDRQPSVASRPAPAPVPPPAPPTPKEAPRPAKPDTKATPLERPTGPDGTSARRPAEAEPKPPEPKTVPDLQTLTQISPQTLASIESDWRRKYREDVAKGDTVWLDSEQDLLSSFMRRFRDKIYMVWNYPSYAAERGMEGTCLLRITITRAGQVADVQLLESSGYGALDEEAMDAVRKGATYGPLPRAYPHQDLKIMAFFKYNLGVRTDVY